MIAYCGNNPVIRSDSSGQQWFENQTIIDKFLHDANDFFLSLGVDTAAIGAFFLQMYESHAGVYHASSDGWQKHIRTPPGKSDSTVCHRFFCVLFVLRLCRLCMPRAPAKRQKAQQNNCHCMSYFHMLHPS